MNVNELLDTIEDALEESAGMPLSGGKRIVDVEQIRDYLDEIRQNLPVDLRQAQSIVSDRAQLIDSANAQAQAIVKKAEDRARILVSEAEIVKAAQQRASEIVSAAQTEARTVRQPAHFRHHNIQDRQVRTLLLRRLQRLLSVFGFQHQIPFTFQIQLQQFSDISVILCDENFLHSLFLSFFHHKLQNHIFPALFLFYHVI